MKENYAEIFMVLDKSGSMEIIRTDVIGGFNSFIKEQKELPGDCNFSLVLFDTSYEELYLNKPIKDVPLLTTKEYIPTGSTALLDALGKSITLLGDRLDKMEEKDKPSKVIFVIYTDGQENSSKEFSSEFIRNKIKEQQEKYSWEFIFLGANQDSFSVASSYGINATAFNTFNYASTAVGVGTSYASLNRSVTKSRTGKTNP
jgi:uncharacterized protein YegL